ncbi:hypothetical protein BB034_10985 [Neisseria gonorrhoeae]|nr:hypothetical protein BB034_10985 [Neisseria gonorrhoeae]
MTVRVFLTIHRAVATVFSTPSGKNLVDLQKPVRRCLALDQLERFSKMLKHQVNWSRPILAYI